MKIVKLSMSYVNYIMPFFETNNLTNIDSYPIQYQFTNNDLKFINLYYKKFCETYLTELKNYHAYGAIHDNKITGILSFYESTDDASWYWNNMIVINDKKVKNALLDVVITHNELNGRYKFYNIIQYKYLNSYRKTIFSSDVIKRYDYFDEYYVESKNQCKFNLIWQILYERTLLPFDTVVRCTYLKQKYRTLTNAGNI